MNYVSLSISMALRFKYFDSNLNNRLIRMLGLTHEVEVISFEHFLGNFAH